MAIHKTAEKTGKRVELVGKNWDIMNALSERGYYGRELAKKLGRHSSEISVSLKYLKEEELVESQQKEGEKTKHFYLSNLGRRIFKAVIEVVRLEPEGRLENWQIKKLLAILSDNKIDKKVRASYSSVFDALSRENPMQLISHSGVPELIQGIVANAPIDEINEVLNRSVPVLLSHALQDEVWRGWVKKKIYPILFKNVKSESEKTRVRAIRQLVQLAALGQDLELAPDVGKRLLELWFSDKTDVSGNFRDEVREQLVLVCLHDNSTNAEAIFDEVRKKAADENPHTKEKAGKLLESLKECILPRKVPVSERSPQSTVTR